MIVETVIGSVFLLLLSCVLLLNLLSLPANWIVLGLVGTWRYINPSPGDMGTTFFVMLAGLAILGEAIEFLAQAWGAKKYGSSTSGMWAGLLGALVGAFVGLPFFFGLGALVGALTGAWLGSYALEKIRGRSEAEAARAAKGSLMGRFLGIVIKSAIGVIMVGLVYRAIWPASSAAQLPLTVL